MTDLQKTIEKLYATLESISGEHEEVTDTDVREAIHEVFNYYFVWDQPISRLPCTYYMFSQAGDSAVAEAVAEFLRAAKPLASKAKLERGQPRLDALQDEILQTPGGEQFDLFIGYAERPLPLAPLSDALFAPGAYD